MKRTLLLAFVALTAMAIQAKQVSEQDALQKAKDFMQGKIFSVAHRALGTGASDDAFYVFNAQNGGFVIVSGEDSTSPILAYSESGHLDVNNLPDNLNAWLGKYERQIRYLRANGLSAPVRSRRSGTSVAPLLNFAWNQDAPFNHDCKVTPEGYSEIQCVTGCVATALAQILYYNVKKHGNTAKISATAIPGYSYNYKFEEPSTLSANCTVSDLSDTLFDWDNIKGYYSSSATGAEADAVAKLLHYCGVALKMTYTDWFSGSHERDVPYILHTYFGYPNTIEFKRSGNYLWEEWEDMLRAELKAGRPILYGADNSKVPDTGHAFIIDGYDATTGKYHINWGWDRYGDGEGSEYYNGYFDLTVMEPPHVTNQAYNENEDAVFGIAPGSDVADPKEHMTATEFGIVSNDYVTCRHWNDTGHTASFDFGYGDISTSSIEPLKTTQYDNLPAHSGFGTGNSATKILITTILSGKPAGTYKIVPISKIKEKTEWQISNNGKTNYVEVVWDGTAVTSKQQYPCCAFYDKDGNLISRSNEENLTVPDNASYVDLSKFDCTSITPNSNANTLYYLGANQLIPTALSSKIYINGETAGEITLTEGSNIYVPKAFTASTVHYNRTLTAGSDAYTVCLPYAPPTTIGVTYYTLSAVDGTTLTFSEVASPAANTPYLAIPSSTVTDLGTTNANFVVTSINNPSAVSSYEFKGTLTGMSNAEASAANAYILQSANTWGKVTTTNTSAVIPPYRAYIVSSSGSRSLTSVFGDDATGIQNIRTIDKDGTERWFDLNGRLINGKPSQKGIYVNNGRKVIIK